MTGGVLAYMKLAAKPPSHLFIQTVADREFPHALQIPLRIKFLELKTRTALKPIVGSEAAPV